MVSGIHLDVPRSFIGWSWVVRRGKGRREWSLRGWTLPEDSEEVLSTSSTDGIPESEWQRRQGRRNGVLQTFWGKTDPEISLHLCSSRKPKSKFVKVDWKEKHKGKERKTRITGISRNHIINSISTSENFNNQKGESHIKDTHF